MKLQAQSLVLRLLLPLVRRPGKSPHLCLGYSDGKNEGEFVGKVREVDDYNVEATRELRLTRRSARHLLKMEARCVTRMSVQASASYPTRMRSE